MVLRQVAGPILTIITQCYGQPKMLAEWVGTHSRWDRASQEKAAVVVVDDHGNPRVEPSDLAPLKGFASVDLYRVEKDIPWNQMGARNLAMLKAPTQVCVMLDIDMMIEPGDAERFLREAEVLKPGEVLMFALRDLDRDCGINLTSPNTWFLSQSDFLRVGGYNEDFAGTKGWSDVELMHVLMSAYRVTKRRDMVASWHSNCVGTQDALVHSLDRDVGVNGAKHRAHAKRVAIRYGGNWAKWAMDSKRQSVRFPWSHLRVSP